MFSGGMRTQLVVQEEHLDQGLRTDQDRRTDQDLRTDQDRLSERNLQTKHKLDLPVPKG